MLLTYMYDDDGNGPSPEEIKAKLSSMNASCTMGRETAPSTGRMHIHVYAHCPKGFNTRNSRAFDVYTYHPNMRLINSTHQKAYDYVVKGKNIPIQDVPRPVKASARSAAIDEVFKNGMAQPTYTSMMNVIADGAPSRYAMSYLNIKACAKDRFPTQLTSAYSHPDTATFNTAGWPEIKAWVDAYIVRRQGRDSESVPDDTPSLSSGTSVQSIDDNDGTEDWWLGTPAAQAQDAPTLPRYYTPSPIPLVLPLSGIQTRPKSLILWGPSRTGKTCWARSLGRHVHHANTFNMELHDDDADYAIFDDISGGLRSFDYKAWMGGQLHFSITDKYMKKRSITWGRPCIYLSNENPLLDARGVDLDWLLANAVVVNIDRSMY